MHIVLCHKLKKSFYIVFNTSSTNIIFLVYSAAQFLEPLCNTQLCTWTHWTRLHAHNYQHEKTQTVTWISDRKKHSASWDAFSFARRSACICFRKLLMRQQGISYVQSPVPPQLIPDTRCLIHKARLPDKLERSRAYSVNSLYGQKECTDSQGPYCLSY